MLQPAQPRLLLFLFWLTGIFKLIYIVSQLITIITIKELKLSLLSYSLWSWFNWPLIKPNRRLKKKGGEKRLWPNRTWPRLPSLANKHLLDCLKLTFSPIVIHKLDYVSTLLSSASFLLVVLSKPPTFQV